MLGILIKNNLKLMLRSKIVIVLMLLGPVITIAAVSSGFSSLMAKYKAPDEFDVGYQCIDQEVEQFVDALKKPANEAGIHLVSFEGEDYDYEINQKHFKVAVKFTSDSYTIYKNKDSETESMIVEYFLTSAYQNQTSALLARTMSVTGDVNEVSQPVISIEETTVSRTPTAESVDYYGIIYIIYFLWCGIVGLSAVITSERKNRISSRYGISNLSQIQLFLGYAIPCILAVSIETMAAVAITAPLYSIHWGAILPSALILFLGCIAATSFGLFAFYLFHNTTLSVIFVFCLVWFSGFLGGTFESYMFTATPESLQKLFPIYYMNRTLVEYSTMGHSSMTDVTVIYLTVFSVVFCLLAILLMNRRMEEY